MSLYRSFSPTGFCPGFYIGYASWNCFFSWARIRKILRSPGIDSKEKIPPAYAAWRAGTTNRLAESIHWNWFLGSLQFYKSGLWCVLLLFIFIDYWQLCCFFSRLNVPFMSYSDVAEYSFSTCTNTRIRVSNFRSFFIQNSYTFFYRWRAVECNKRF